MSRVLGPLKGSWSPSPGSPTHSGSGYACLHQRAHACLHRCSNASSSYCSGMWNVAAAATDMALSGTTRTPQGLTRSVLGAHERYHPVIHSSASIQGGFAALISKGVQSHRSLRVSATIQAKAKGDIVARPGGQPSVVNCQPSRVCVRTPVSCKGRDLLFSSCGHPRTCLQEPSVIQTARCRVQGYVASAISAKVSLRHVHTPPSLYSQE